MEAPPAGLRVLAVDDDAICLLVVTRMLRRFTACRNGSDAMARVRSESFDLVLSDVHMPDIDGFKLLQAIALEMDVPVIMMSGSGDTTTVLKGLTSGAVDYLLKPLQMEELRAIWQHILRRPRPAPESDAGHDASRKARSKRAKEEGEAAAEEEGAAGVTAKKARVVWSVELHQCFVEAVNVLGVDKAVPRRILDLMGVAGLTRENVASHLQKYRLYLKRVQTNQERDSRAAAPAPRAPPPATPPPPSPGLEFLPSMSETDLDPPLPLDSGDVDASLMLLDDPMAPLEATSTDDLLMRLFLRDAALA